MRTFALLVLLSPSLALAKHHVREKPRAVAHASAPVASAEPAPVRSAPVEQADDDERPGSRQKK